MAVGAADPWWPPSGGALPAPNNERKGLAPHPATVFPLTEGRAEALSVPAPRLLEEGCAGSLTFPQLGRSWPGNRQQRIFRLFAQFPTGL